MLNHVLLALQIICIAKCTAGGGGGTAVCELSMHMLYCHLAVGSMQERQLSWCYLSASFACDIFLPSSLVAEA